jgi:hypothetical protein
MARVAKEDGVRRIRARRNGDGNEVAAGVLQEVVDNARADHLDGSGKVPVKEDGGFLASVDLSQLGKGDEEGEGKGRVLKVLVVVLTHEFYPPQALDKPCSAGR